MRDPNCSACPLHKKAATICVWGEGPTQARLMIVGMAPGAMEDTQGRPFVGAAGSILNDALRQAGLRREDIYVTNAVKCFPGKTRPTRTDISICAEKYLQHEISFVRPELIVAMGDVAMLSLTNRSGVKANRGKLLELRPGLGGGIPVLVTYHPAAFLHSGRDQNIVRAIVADLSRAKSILEGADTRLDVVEDRAVLESKVLAVDVETSKDGSLILGTLASEDGRYWPFGPDNAAEVFSGLTGKKILVWNAKFDLMVLEKYGVKLDPESVVDVMLLLHLLDSGRQGRYSLEAAVLDEWGWADEQWQVMKRRVHGGEDVPREELVRYCAQDSVYTARLYKAYKERMSRFPRLPVLYRTLVRPAIEVLRRVETTPVPLDMTYLEQLDRDLQAASEELAKQMADLAGLREVPNFRSNRVLVEVLYEKLSLPVVKLTESGQPSTDRSVLLGLAELSPFVGLLLKYRKLCKLHSAYVRRWLKLYKDAPYYATYNIHGTVSGRLSSDFQQVPRPADDPSLPNIRDAVVAPDGYLVLEADYSMLELRLIAWYAPEEHLLRLIREGVDVHRHTASILFGVDPEQVTKIMRHTGKTANFGLGYGASPATLAEVMRLAMTTDQIREVCELLGAEGGLLDAAAKIHSLWHESYPGIRRWHLQERSAILSSGRAVAPHGRIRWLPKARTGSRADQIEAVREGCNHVIQSLASDLTLLAAVHAAPQIWEAGGLGPWPTHDSLLWIVPEAHAMSLATHLKKVMEGIPELAARLWAVNITVPLEAELKLGKRWGSLEELQFS